MKKILFASTALVASAGFAAADADFTGAAGFGMIYDGTNWNPDYYTTLNISLTGETDGGLSFGADLDLTFDNGGFGVTDNQVVYIEGGFGKLSVGTVDNAVDASVSGIKDVGYSGLGVDNLAEAEKGTSTANALYQGTFGDFSVALSGDLSSGASDWAIGAKYAMGDFKVGAGVEKDGGNTVYAISAGATFGDIALNALYGRDSTASNYSYGVDAGYTMGASTITIAYGNDDGVEGYGLGISYDLGGGASVDAGVAEVNGVTKADLGINMTF
ncbi:porin [uncultured Aliiroseovarius sp.]|uniref:porin n=1 Tax=uncultured Aliiroseovarius sp. TaxID=1658783 RepID=UPI0026259FC7|nr:porin [uncultured Aliiroseovarius sp.]